jgi:phage baseplate assembly protein W
MPKRTIKGFGFPIQKTAHGFFHRVDDVAAIKSDLIQLLLTEPGERVMFPSFGTGLRGFLFEPSDPTLSEAIRERVIQAISIWENRVVVTRIDVFWGDDNKDSGGLDYDKLIKIEIDFMLKSDLGATETLSLGLNTSAG